MAYKLPRKGIVDALAYCTPNSVSPLFCSLVVKYSKDHKQATISLRLSIPISGFDPEQSITLYYDANNLVPGETSLGSAAVLPSQDQLRKIVQQGKCELKTLSLVLRNHCSVEGPSVKKIAPKKSSESCFYLLADLAQATTVYILFDYNSFSKDEQARFEHCIEHIGDLTSFRVGSDYAKRPKLPDWTIFRPAEEVDFEQPPPYACTSRKRSKDERDSLSPGPPSFKRLTFSPSVVAPSPTEKAPSPEPFSPFVTAASGFQEIIKEAVRGTVKEAVQGAAKEAVQEAVKEAVQGAVKEAVQEIVNAELRAALLGAVNAAIADALPNLFATHLKSQLEAACVEVQDHATQLYENAEAQLGDDVDEYKVEISIAKEDGITELDEALKTKLDELEQSAVDTKESIEDHGQKTYNGFHDKLNQLADGIVGKSGKELVRQKRALGWSAERKRWSDERLKRSKSAPLQL